MCGFPVSGGKSAEHFGRVRHMWESLLMIHSTKPAPFHHSWCKSSYKKTVYTLFPESAVFFLKSHFKLRENFSLSYTAFFQLPGLCPKPSNNYLCSCWRKCDNDLNFLMYTHSSILIGSQSTLKKCIETSFWACRSLALQKIKHAPLLLLRENIPAVDNEKEKWRESVGEICDCIH